MYEHTCVSSINVGHFYEIIAHGDTTFIMRRPPNKYVNDGGHCLNMFIDDFMHTLDWRCQNLLGNCEVNNMKLGSQEIYINGLGDTNASFE